MTDRPLPVTVREAGKRPREVARYKYLAKDGTPLFDVVRFEPKDFRQQARDPDGTPGPWSLNGVEPVLYRLPKLIAAVAAGETIYVVEGEKDVHAAEAVGLVATTAPMGALKWRDTYSEVLRDARVMIVADRDEAGYKHAHAVTRALRGIAASVQLVEPIEGKDLSDHLAAGATPGMLVVVPAEQDSQGFPQLGNQPPTHDANAPLQFESVAQALAILRSEKPPQWLARPVWTAEDYGVIAAEWKAGKTWAVGDLAISVASATPWLGLFPCEVHGPVLMFIGEGGRRKTIRRLEAIARGRGLDLAALPIELCYRVPHLSDTEHLELLRAKVAATSPRLIVVDPLYLAARGAKGQSLYEMGGVLESLQHVAQDARAAMAVTHHFNRDKSRKGSERFSGAGPAEWGRVLVAVDVVERMSEPPASVVLLDFAFAGDEIPNTKVRIRRRVWAEDPDDLRSAMHYEVEQLAADDPASADEPSPFSAKGRILGILREADRSLRADEVQERTAHDRAVLDRGMKPLKLNTVKKALGTLRDEGLAASLGEASAGFEWVLAIVSVDSSESTPSDSSTEDLTSAF